VQTAAEPTYIERIIRQLTRAGNPAALRQESLRLTGVPVTHKPFD
jgi:hypothetical protein